MESESLAGYNAAVDDAAYYVLIRPGYLRLSGPDQTAFLQRQTTNDMSLLTADRALLTVLTNPAARILDVFYLIQEGDGIGILTLPGRSASTYRYLKSRIFFMDKVELADASEQMGQIDLLGPQSSEALARLGLFPPEEAGQTLRGNLDGQELAVIKLDPSFGPGYRLVIPAASLEKAAVVLENAGAAHLDEAAYEALRVEGGLPAAGRELTEAYTPLETGMQTAVSGTKGCYTGQEILARQITYDKVTQRLGGLRLQRPVEAGMRVWAEGRLAGEITSAVTSPRFGPIALAILKRANSAPGTVLIASAAAPTGGSDGEVDAVVVPLPFQSA